ncbi:lysosomal thioesterase PPT2 [Silurus meridionalis]|uniref:lysosomal thioesterase PPT2 n=1 Tax=Silurus meridionalis TaxID=175797 RepID=UPI001EEC8BB8|nr:lysosomal thioesterase PPT2 [Silurus meridionalis]XP_046714731.1 lysosomal thioesterase PPT2 [Silurus meridionalis]
MRRRCVREECVWSSVLVCVSVLLCGSVCVFGYKPVIIIHGLFDTPADFINLQRYINQSHPGTNVTVIDLFDRSESLEPLWKQVEGFKEAIYPIMQNSADGVHLLCYSQGGLICRGILSTLKDHNVHSFISLSSPQAGQYGDTDYLKYIFPKYVRSKVYLLCYNTVGQKISICNYWNDPHHRDMYLNTSNYLALLNNEKPHPDSTVWKQNFLRIGKLVLIGGPDDGVIMPWQSSQFGFYDDNETVVEMKDQEVFLRDSFGLKSLYARGDLELCSVAGVEHVYWHSNETVYKRCIEKWLT